MSEEQWSCGVCTFLNHPAIFECECCLSARPPPEDEEPVVRPPSPDPIILDPDEVTPIIIDDNPILFEDAQKPTPETVEYLSNLYGSAVSDKRVDGIQNLVKKMLKMEQFNFGNDPNWLMKADRTVVLQALQKAQRSSELICDLVNVAVRAEEASLDLQCSKCGASSVDAIIHVLESCQHAFCGLCIREYTLNLVDNLRCNDMKCLHPRCDGDLPTAVIQQTMMPNEFERYLAATMESFINCDSNDGGKFVKCPIEKCATVVNVVSQDNAVVPEKITVVGNDNLPISIESWLHYNQNRIRCRGCQENFCISCLAVPYHTGYNCDQFREYGAAKHCRFCTTQLSIQNTAPSLGKPALADVCTEDECIERRGQSCSTTLGCGHACGGVSDEKEHLPCLGEDCKDHAVPQLSGDLCCICYIEGLEQAPCIRLKCTHIFHRHCILSKINSKWPNVRITFGFLKCPLCPQIIEHPSLVDDPVISSLVQLYKKIQEKSLFRLKVDGLEDDDKLTNPASKWFKQPLEFAMNSFAYYNCFKCNQEYFGGRRDCEQNADAEKRPPEEFVCFDCADIKAAACTQGTHKEFHVYKCRFCCSTAVWFCWGTTHFCDGCHSDRPWDRAKWSRDKFKQCKGKHYCPLKVDHAPNGSEAECEDSLGCAMCMDEIRKREDENNQEKEIDDKLDGKKPKNKKKSESRKKKRMWSVF
uniref:RanBP-type and C3HC4-type zinc finger-containing protein 1 n=1 Tax=Hirondellea gigas TaxID=1518452 RepID=A0A6A7FXV8_9CRUS